MTSCEVICKASDDCTHLLQHLLTAAALLTTVALQSVPTSQPNPRMFMPNGERSVLLSATAC